MDVYLENYLLPFLTSELSSITAEFDIHRPFKFSPLGNLIPVLSPAPIFQVYSFTFIFRRFVSLCAWFAGIVCLSVVFCCDTIHIFVSSSAGISGSA